MPYEPHDLFTDPEENTLWRYLDFTKFVSIINTNSLFFPSARTLQKIDPWEGSYLKKELVHILNEEKLLKPTTDFSTEFDYIKQKANDWLLCFENEADSNFISCWHYNSYESAAMWGLYLKSNEGLCIQTDIQSFKDSFKDETKRIFIGMVRYKEYETDFFYSGFDMNKIEYPSFSFFHPFIHKRKIYDHEKEYRAIVPLFGNRSDNCKNGLMIKVNLKTLIKRIVLAPASPEWFEELVRSTLKKYDLDFPVTKSMVDDKPYEFDLSPYEPKK